MNTNVMKTKADQCVSSSVGQVWTSQSTKSVNQTSNEARRSGADANNLIMCNYPSTEHLLFWDGCHSFCICKAVIDFFKKKLWKHFNSLSRPFKDPLILFLLYVIMLYCLKISVTVSIMDADLYVCSHLPNNYFWVNVDFNCVFTLTDLWHHKVSIHFLKKNY